MQLMKRKYSQQQQQEGQAAGSTRAVRDAGAAAAAGAVGAAAAGVKAANNVGARSRLVRPAAQLTAAKTAEQWQQQQLQTLAAAMAAAGGSHLAAVPAVGAGSGELEQRVMEARKAALQAQRSAQQYKEQANAAMAALQQAEKKLKDERERHLSEQVCGWASVVGCGVQGG
jgi:hypothetical protein